MNRFNFLIFDSAFVLSASSQTYLIQEVPIDYLLLFLIEGQTLHKNVVIADFKLMLHKQGLSQIADFSKISFKNTVKKRAKEFAFFVFLEKKQKHSKLDNLFYRDLNIQHYLQSKLSTEGQVIFSYRTRTRMSNYSDNFRGSGGTSVCPLCQNHPDNQKWSFECSKVKENINIEGKYSNIFSEKITKATVNTLMQINKLRTDFLEQRNIK